MKFAVIKTGGKQYKVAEGDTLKVEKLATAEGEVTFDQVLLYADGDDITVGKPFIPSATVTAKIVEEAKDKKKIVFRFKAKTRRRKKKGHRQIQAKIQIEKISI